MGLLIWVGAGGEPCGVCMSQVRSWAGGTSRCLRGIGLRLGSGWFPAVGSSGGVRLGIPMSRSAVSYECCLHFYLVWVPSHISLLPSTNTSTSTGNTTSPTQPHDPQANYDP